MVGNDCRPCIDEQCETIEVTHSLPAASISPNHVELSQPISTMLPIVSPRLPQHDKFSAMLVWLFHGNSIASMCLFVYASSTIDFGPRADCVIHFLQEAGCIVD